MQTRLQSCSSEKYLPWTLPGSGQSTSRAKRRKGGLLRMLRCMCVYKVLSVFITSLFDVKANLGVLHHTLNAVKVGQVTDRLIGVVQHSSDSLRDKQSSSRLTLREIYIYYSLLFQSNFYYYYHYFILDPTNLPAVNTPKHLRLSYINNHHFFWY